jgi:hypothetical protein
VALDRGQDLQGPASDLESRLASLRKTIAPLETWRSARVLAIVKRRLGDDTGADASLAAAADSVRTIVAGTRDEGLRASFLAIPAVQEVLAGAGGSV